MAYLVINNILHTLLIEELIYINNKAHGDLSQPQDTTKNQRAQLQVAWLTQPQQR